MTSHTDKATIAPFESRHAVGVARLWDQDQPGKGQAWWRRFEWQYVRNPLAVEPGDSGWVLLDASNQVVGSKLWMPQRFRVGAEEHTIHVSTDTIVHPDYRHQSLSLILRYFREHARPFALSTSAGGKHAEIWLRRRGQPVPGSDCRRLILLHPRRFFGERFGHRWLGAACGIAWTLSRATRRRRPRGPVAVEAVAPEDPRLDDLWQAGIRNDAVIGIRDRAFRLWRFRAPDVRLLLASQRYGVPRLWVALANREATEAPGSRAAILDIGGPRDDRESTVNAMAAILAKLAAEGYAAADFDGFSPFWHGVLDDLGALRRPAPSHMLFIGPDVAATQALLALDWHVTPADGDAGFAAMVMPFRNEWNRNE